MPVRIRLARFGKTNSPFYHIRVADSKRARDGKFLEKIGTYNPIAGKDGIREVRVNIDRAKYWIGVGAQPSPTVASLFGKIGLLPPYFIDMEK